MFNPNLSVHISDTRTFQTASRLRYARLAVFLLSSRAYSRQEPYYPTFLSWIRTTSPAPRLNPYAFKTAAQPALIAVLDMHSIDDAHGQAGPIRLRLRQMRGKTTSICPESRRPRRHKPPNHTKRGRARITADPAPCSTGLSDAPVTRRTGCRRRSGPASSRRPRSLPWRPRRSGASPWRERPHARTHRPAPGRQGPRPSGGRRQGP